MNPILQWVIGISAVAGPPFIIYFMSRGAKQRDDAAIARDIRLDTIDGNIVRLVEKVGAQNGRIGKLEDGKTSSSGQIDGLLERELARLNAEVVEARSGKRRSR